MNSTIKPSCDQLINIMPDPFVVIDREYNIVAANAAYCERNGVAPDKVVGRRCYEVSHHSDAPCSEHGEHCPLVEVLEAKQPTQVMHVHYDNDGNEEYVQLHAHPLVDEKGEVHFIGETMYHVASPEGAEGPLLVGQSQPLLRMTSLLQRVAPTNTTVLLLGESGVGKEQVAKYIHHFSKRSQGPFVVLDCASLGENLIESELFGYEKGAFTGAAQRKKGLFEAAIGGTLFIDEVGELPLPLQTKLLRALETGQIRRIGGTEYIKVDVRIVTATHRDLQSMVAAGEFRQDLYYRLSAFPIQVPALRDRTDDIPRIAEHFLARMVDGERHLPLDPAVIQVLMTYDYPGNVRELRNVIERAAILASDDVMRPGHIQFDSAPEPALSTRETADQSMPVRILSRRHGRLNEDSVVQALELARGHRARAAELLGVSERTLYRYIKRLRGEDRDTDSELS